MLSQDFDNIVWNVGSNFASKLESSQRYFRKGPQRQTPELNDMRKIILALAVMLASIAAQAKTLIVYYSYTNNVERIVNELRAQIDADVLEIQPTAFQPGCT